MRTAILIVDMQNDFVEGGALACVGGTALVPLINAIVKEVPFELVITTQDWHPEDTPHFIKWPQHCVAYSKGAAFVDGLYVPPSFVQLKKGQGDADDYSAFDAVGYYTPDIGLTCNDILHRNSIEALFVCGIATDHCVKATVLDAIAKKYEVFLLENACVGVTPKGHAAAVDDMKQAGAHILKLYPKGHNAKQNP